MTLNSTEKAAMVFTGIIYLMGWGAAFGGDNTVFDANRLASSEEDTRVSDENYLDWPAEKEAEKGQSKFNYLPVVAVIVVVVGILILLGYWGNSKFLKVFDFLKKFSVF